MTRVDNLQWLLGTRGDSRCRYPMAAPAAAGRPVMGTAAGRREPQE